MRIKTNGKIFAVGLACLFLGSMFLSTITAQGITVDQTSSGMTSETANVDSNSENGVEFYAVIFGINKYKAYFYDCGYADFDAENMFELLKNKKNWKEENIKLFLNEEVTEKNIMASIEWLSNVSDENDVVLFYYAGHGMPLKHKYLQTRHAYITTYTMVKISDIRLAEEFEKIKADRIVALLDACWTARMTALIKPGIIVISAGGKYLFCRADWDPEIESGILSYYLRQGLEGGADLEGNVDGVISIEEMYYYSYQRTIMHSFVYHNDVKNIKGLLYLLSGFPGIQFPFLYDNCPGETPLVYL